MARNPDFTGQIRQLAAPDAAACDAVIASLPFHFGHEGGRREAARAVRMSDGLVATLDGEVVGFLTVLRHFAAAAEITWMAVHADHRGQGIGTALIAQLRRDLIAEGRTLLLVFTLAESGDAPGEENGYQRTRAFYQSRGFIPAREFPDLWPGNPALLLVMPLGSH